MPVHLLPATRRVLLLAMSLFSATNLCATAALLAYSLRYTTGYNKPVPALLAGSIVGLFVPIYFLFPLPGAIRDRLPRHVKSVMAELVIMGGLVAYMLSTVADLHADTPGLLSTCGGFPICKYLTAVLALSWLIILSLLLAIGTLLSATLYLTSRRHTLVPCHRQAFDEVAWDVYSPKLARGISVSRRLDRQAAREAREGGAGGGRRAEAEKKRRAQNEVREAVAAQAAEAALAGAEGRPEMGERKETVVDFAALPQLKREPSVKRIPKVGSVGIIRQDSAIAMAPLQEEKELVEL